MARSDLLLNMVKAASGGDQVLLRRTLEALIAEERATGLLCSTAQARRRDVMRHHDARRFGEDETGFLEVLAQSLDRIRGEQLHAWRQIDSNQFWLVSCDNLMVVGRRKAVKSCHFWTSALESALRRAGLANEWVVDEVECGCVTGTFDCAFRIQRA